MKKILFYGILIATCLLTMSCDESQSIDSSVPFSTTYIDLSNFLKAKIDETIQHFTAEGYRVVSEDALEYGHVELYKYNHADEEIDQEFIFYFDTNTRMVNQSVFCHEGPSRGGESEKGCCIALLKQQRAMAEKMCERDFKCYVRWSAPGHNSGTERVFDTFDDVIEYLEGTSNVDFLAMISAAGVEGNAANFSAIVWRDKAVEYSISIGGKLSNIPPRCKSDMK